jgi:outer membrane protein OmpA-like peptidoglycan-associated protein
MTLNTDQHFATDSFRINEEGRRKLANFFGSAKATSFVVVGHTDSRASDEYNMRLGLNRARAVAAVGQQVGARIVDVRSFGERMPAATNATPAGRFQNRRVEIMCIR